MKWDQKDIIFQSDLKQVKTSRQSASPSTGRAAARCVSQQIWASIGYLCLDYRVYCLYAKGKNPQACIEYQAASCAARISAKWVAAVSWIPNVQFSIDEKMKRFRCDTQPLGHHSGGNRVISPCRQSASYIIIWLQMRSLTTSRSSSLIFSQMQLKAVTTFKNTNKTLKPVMVMHVPWSFYAI